MKEGNKVRDATDFVSKTFDKKDNVSDLGNIRDEAKKSKEVVTKSKAIGRKSSQKFVADDMADNGFKVEEKVEETENMNTVPRQLLPKKEAIKSKGKEKAKKKTTKEVTNKDKLSKYDYDVSKESEFRADRELSGFELNKDFSYEGAEENKSEQKSSGNEIKKSNQKRRIKSEYSKRFSGRVKDENFAADNFLFDKKDEKTAESDSKLYQKNKNKKDAVVRFAEEKKSYEMGKVFDEKSGLYVYRVLEDEPTIKVRDVKNYYKRLHGRELSKKFLTESREFLHQEVRNNDEDNNSAVEAMNESIKSSHSAFDFTVDRASEIDNKRRSNHNKFSFDFKDSKDAGKMKKASDSISNPNFSKTNEKKAIQKLHIKKRYEKGRRMARSVEETTNATIEASKIATKIAKKIQDLVASHAKVIIVVMLFALFLIVIMGMLVSCGAAAGNALTATMGGTYQSVPAEIDAADLQLTQLEMDLQASIDNIERDHPDYDEYQYNLSEIGHDPYVLINYLSAKYIDFEASGVSGEVLSIFNSMYNLTLTPINETRTRRVHNDETDEDEDQEYTVKILRVTLTRTPIESVVNGRMNADNRQMNDVYKDTKGALQIFASPVDYYWYNYISSYYGYRKNPNTGVAEIHRGLDIAVPDGTTVYATHAGRVMEATYDSYYGNYVVIKDSKGYTTKYGHLKNLSVSAGQTVREGTVIGLTGNTGTATGSHLHVECLYEGTYYNPLFYFNAGEQTMYGENTGGSGETDFDIPPYSDEQVAALIHEAERYLHMPYVWGGSSPSTGFDCSGFVCWVFKNSGTYPLERTTGQGIYNKCRPISASDAKAGDIIFFTGTYNSGHPVSHVGIYCGNGIMIHCGDPIKYASINTPYWQSHFYGFGRLIN